MSWHGLDEWQQWALGIGCGLATALLLWFGKKLFFPKRGVGHSTAHTIQQNASPVMTQNFNPVINVHPPEAAAVKTAVQNTKAIAAPHFEYKGCRERPVLISPHARCGITKPRDSEEQENSNQALVFMFENVPSEGRDTRALDVVAKLSFRSADHVTEQAIDYGVWLNSPANCTDMDVGDTRELLICFDGEEIY